MSSSAPPCPDPSAHQHTNKLSEQASSAALLATQHDRQIQSKDSESVNPLGPDGKLSAKGAATSLKYAKAQDLPSFPSRGIAADSAGKAALLAKDYKMKDLWQPETSNAAAKASTLAARDGGKVDLWHATPNAASNSAATLAMKNTNLGPEIYRGSNAENQNKALLAATQSHNKSHKKSDSVSSTKTPPTYPDQENSTANALNAATVSHRNSKMAPDGWESEANQAARIQNASHIDPKMYTEHPPVEIEVEEKRHQAALRASAISMAKQMYDVQQKQAVPGANLAGGREGATTAHARQAAPASTDIKAEAMRYIHLQDTAHKLAQERLAKIDKDMEHSKYREHYGYPDESASRKSLNRLSIRGKTRNRASSNVTSDDVDSDDEEQARRIRGQMSQLSSGLNSVDEKKRVDDRARLMAAAEKRVHAQMHDMDERVFQDTGKVTPAMMEEWESKARQRVQEEKELQATHAGKTHIGGGKFIDQAELEAIAAARLKPTLDEINDTVEKKRARDEQIRQEKEEAERLKREEKQQHKEEKAEQARIKQVEKQHHKEEKEEQKRIKNEEKLAAKQEKDQQKAQKEAEKARLEAEKRKSREQARESVIVPNTGAVAGAASAEDNASRTEKAEPSEAKGDRRSGIFGRISSKLKRDSKKPEEDPVAEKKSRDSHRDAAAAALVGGTVGGAAIAEHEEQPLTSTAVQQENTTSDALTMEGVKPVQPVEAVEPVEELERTTSGIEHGHTGDYTDAIPPPTAVSTRPNLERHITTVETSDEDSEDDEVAERTPYHKQGPELSHPKEAVAATAAAAPVATVAEKEHEDTHVTSEPVVRDTPAQTSSSFVQPESSVAQTAHEPTTVITNVDQPTTTLDHSRDPVSPLAADELAAEKSASRPIDDISKSSAPAPIVTSELEEPKPESPKVSPVVEEPIAASVNPIVSAAQDSEAEKRTEQTSTQSSTVLGRPIAGRGGGVGIAAYDGPSTRGDTGPAPNTIGPHESDIANILDPRVRPDPSKMKERGTAGPHKSDLLNILDPRVESDPVKAEQKAQQEATKLQKKQPEPEAESSEKKKGFRGLLSKLKPRPSQSESKLIKHPDNTEKGEIAAAPVTIVANPSEKAPQLPEIDTKDDGDLEDDVTRGRSTSVKNNELQPTTTNNEDEQFEEARDHFDESLAPPPTFAAQGKSTSPVRGTKFQEVGI